MIEFRTMDTPAQSDFEKQQLSAVVVVLFNRNGEVFLKKKKNPNEHGVREVSMISGSGPLKVRPDKPDHAAIREINHSIGLVNLELWRGFVDEESKVGVYIGIMDNPDEALDMEHGKSVDRMWVDANEAANMELAFGQEKYLEQAIRLISEQD
jgi:hypothetical protein